MFYMFMFIDLILIGASFFLWLQLNREGLVVEATGVSVTKEKPTKPPKREKVAAPKSIKKEKNKKSFFKKGKDKDKELEQEFEDDISWGDFGIVKRDKNSYQEKKEMDEMLGFQEEKEDDNFLNMFKEENPHRPKTIEEEFGDLFDDDEKEELDHQSDEANSYQDEPDFQSFSNGHKETYDKYESFEQDKDTDKKVSNNYFDDFEQYDNNQVEKDEILNSNEDSLETDGDAYDFLKNYDFDSDDKEAIDEDIFDRARSNNEKKRSAVLFDESEDDDWELDQLKDSLPPLTSNSSESRGTQMKPSNHTASSESSSKPTFSDLDDETDDIFARLQRLSNMMDDQKK